MDKGRSIQGDGRGRLGKQVPSHSPTNPTLPIGAKRPRDAKHGFVAHLRRRVRESTLGGRTGAPRTRDRR